MPNPYPAGEVTLNNSAEKVLKDAKSVRTSVDPGCLGRLRGMERRFSVALDLDRTAPNQIEAMKQFGDRALKLDVTYSKLIRHNQETMDIAKKTLDVNYKLMVLHSIVALGKLCEAVLAVFPATSKVGEVLNGLKKTISTSKDLIEASRAPAPGEKTGKTLEGLLKQLGEQGEALADLIGGVVDVQGGEDKSTTVDSAKLAGKAANIIKLIKGTAATLQQVIECLKHQTAFSTRLGGAATILGIFENLAECYKNGTKAVEDYDNMMKLAGTIGHQKYHARTLRGSSRSLSHASHKAFERAVSQTAAGKARMKIDLVDFSRAINSETEARNWGIQLRAKTRQLDAELKSAQKTLKHYAELYAAEMADLAAKYKQMLPHQAKLLKTLKDVVDYETKTFGPGRHGSIIGHMPGYLRNELKQYNAVLAKAQSRLEIPPAMSEARLRAT